ncbi:MAG: leucine-rich repeat protein [Promethearchaeota archaeon]
MPLDADQIIQRILDQTQLSVEMVHQRLSRLVESLCADSYDFTDSDPIIPRLLAQELGVDLGSPFQFLYPELLFHQEPFKIRIIPFTTLDKQQINRTLQSLLQELSPIIPKYYYRSSSSLLPIDLYRYFFEYPPGGTFVRDGILFHFKINNLLLDLTTLEESVNDFPSFDDFVARATLSRTFTDFPVQRTDDPSQTFLPYSLLDRFFIHPLLWTRFHDENHDNHLHFSYVSLASLCQTPTLTRLTFYNSGTKVIIDTDALQHCPNIEAIEIFDELNTLKKVHFPVDLKLPNLLSFEIVGSSLTNIDLSFLQFSPKLESLHLSGYHQETIDLSPLKHCAALQDVELKYVYVEYIDLSPLRNCLNLTHLSPPTNVPFDVSPFENHPNKHLLFSLF